MPTDVRNPFSFLNKSRNHMTSEERNYANMLVEQSILSGRIDPKIKANPDLMRSYAKGRGSSNPP